MSVSEVDTGRRSIGKSLPKIDGRAKVTGNAKYVSDIRLPGMLWGRILRSPIPHGIIKSISVDAALEVAGVKAVVTAKDTRGGLYGPIIRDEPLLALDKVRFAGEEIAAVAAATKEAAAEALALIKVEFEPLDAVLDVTQAMSPSAPVIHREMGTNIAQRFEIIRGDVDGAFARSECVVTGRFVLPRVSPCCLETTGCVAFVDPTGVLTLYVSTQAPFRVQADVAEALGIPEKKVRVVQPFVGGAFGAKHHVKLAAICGLLALKTMKPVKLINSREEEFVASRHRVPAIIDLKLGFSGDGTLLAKETKIIADNGAYTDLVPRLFETMARRIDSLYRVGAVRTEAILVYTNNPPTGAFRGFGNPQMTFAMESLMDMAAEKLNLDPAELRLRNATRTGDVTIHGWKIKSCGLKECIESACQTAEWKDKRHTKSVVGPKRRGVGMACMIHVAGRKQSPNFAGSVARVEVLPTGKVRIYSGEADIGQGCQTVFAQIVSEELGVSYEDVEVAPVDTDLSPIAFGSFSDRVTILGGNAVQLAARRAREAVLDAAAEILEARIEDLEIIEGAIQVKGSPGKSISLRDVAWIQAVKFGRPISATGEFDPDAVLPDPVTKYGNLAAAYTFATQVAEVEVDIRTGEVRLVKFTCAHDLGRAINRMAAEGQIEGALAQGIGYALSEQIILHNGRVANANLLDYKLSTCLDMPITSVILVESNDPVGPFGAKGVAEPGLVPTAPAIANAIYDAIGVRIYELPITPERIIEALQRRNGESDVTR